MNEYLYSNVDSAAERRLRGLEAIEDESTIANLRQLGVAGRHCLEIGAGAGSIARWLAENVGAAGRVVATDIETHLLDSSAYEVWRHDILKDALPKAAFDLVHLRHVLVHIDKARHLTILRSISSALRPGGLVLAEESDLHTWRAGQGVPETTRAIFTTGVETTLSIYQSRAMNTALGEQLQLQMTEADLAPVSVERWARRVIGGSPEALFHQISARQLASSIREHNSDASTVLEKFADCLVDPNLEYETRTTVSIKASKSTCV